MEKAGLSEGDYVRLPCGRLAKVVGFSIGDKEPYLVMDSTGESWQYDSDSVEFEERGPGKLEPLPSVAKTLQEGAVLESIKFYGDALCFTIKETGQTVTLVPKKQENLKERFTELCKDSKEFRMAVRKIVREAFITRLPHLLSEGANKKIGSSLGMETERAIDVLLRER